MMILGYTVVFNVLLPSRCHFPLANEYLQSRSSRLCGQQPFGGFGMFTLESATKFNVGQKPELRWNCIVLVTGLPDEPLRSIVQGNTTRQITQKSLVAIRKRIQKGLVHDDRTENLFSRLIFLPPHLGMHQRSHLVREVDRGASSFVSGLVILLKDFGDIFL